MFNCFYIEIKFVFIPEDFPLEMSVADLIAILLGLLAVVVAYYFLRKISSLLSTDKNRSARVIENVTAGLLATILFVVLQRYIESVQDTPSIDFNSGWIFLKSVAIALGNLFITTAIMFAVVFFAVYVLLKPVLQSKK